MLLLNLQIFEVLFSVADPFFLYFAPARDILEGIINGTQIKNGDIYEVRGPKSLLKNLLPNLSFSEISKELVIGYPRINKDWVHVQRLEDKKDFYYVID